MATTTRYFKIIGVEQQSDDSLNYTLQEVADFTGAPVAFTRAPITDNYQTAPGANELPRGTIIKVVITQTRQITVNPTS
jgi:hypothetical protein